MASAPHGLIPAGTVAADTEVDLLVVGAGTGIAAALAGSERGLSVLIVEKSPMWVGLPPAREERCGSRRVRC